jgi:seryl-tRNA synthetase
MNIQVIATISCPELLKINKESVLEIYQEKDYVDKVALRKYENYLDSNIRNESDCLNEKKKRFDNNLKKEIKNLNEEKMILKKVNESLKINNARKEEEISILRSENESLKDIIKKTINSSNTENTQIQKVLVPRLNENSSDISIKIDEFLNKFQNKS